LHREFLAKVKPDLVAARDEVYTELRREDGATGKSAAAAATKKYSALLTKGDNGP
jgi:hypothetical protein